MRTAGVFLSLGLVLAGWTAPPEAKRVYQPAPKAMGNPARVNPLPRVSLSPDGKHLLLAQGPRFDRLAMMSRPVLDLAGVLINPADYSTAHARIFESFKLIRMADRKEIAVPLPSGPKRFGLPVWSPDGRHFAFLRYPGGLVELFVSDTKKVWQLKGVRVNAAFGRPFSWMNNGTLLCQTVASLGSPPRRPRTEPGPAIRETQSARTPGRLAREYLNDTYEERLFKHYAMSQLEKVTLRGRRAKLGKPGIFLSYDVSPQGRFVLVKELHEPFPHHLPAQYFPRVTQVWDQQAKPLLISLNPYLERIKAGGVAVRPRGHHWRPTAPDTLTWVEALDRGDPNQPSEHRDRVMLLTFDKDAEPRELMRLEHRFSRIWWGEDSKVALVREYQSSRDWHRTWVVNPEATEPEEAKELLWDMSARERYQHPGMPWMRQLKTGHRAMRIYQGAILLNGLGASPKGDRPFLDRLDLATREVERLFESEPESYEAVMAVLKPDGQQFVTWHETAASPPNYHLRGDGATNRVVITKFVDPAPQLRKVTKRLIRYARPDGVELSCLLYLPPDYDPNDDEKELLPAILWAYPRHFAHGGVAGQVATTPYRYTRYNGASPIFMALEGYAVLDQVAMPVIGDQQSANDTFTQQIVSSARAAVDAVVEMGVVDHERVGVGGHSYGAFMAAMLLAHSDGLFQAGIAKSGAYNRTLTPFGFQDERRTLWQAPGLYLKMSPILNAASIEEPLLLIHGAEDKNPATAPEQSERLYRALKGNSGIARLVILPHEGHFYRAEESIGHVLHEMKGWFDKHVKNRPKSSARR